MLPAKHKHEAAHVRHVWGQRDGDTLQRHLGARNLHVTLLILAAVDKVSLAGNTTFQRDGACWTQRLVRALPVSRACGSIP